MISGVKNDNTIFSRMKQYSANVEEEYKTVVKLSEEGLVLYPYNSTMRK